MCPLEDQDLNFAIRDHGPSLISDVDVQDQNAGRRRELSYLNFDPDPVVDPYRRPEGKLLRKYECAGTRENGADDGGDITNGEHPMDDPAANSDTCGIRFIDMDRVVVTGQLHETGNIFGPNNVVARGLVADYPLLETA